MNHKAMSNRKSREQLDIARAEKIKRIEQEIANLCVILKALPDHEEGAIAIISGQIAALRKQLPKHTGRIWWHWLLEWCPKCNCCASQQPFSEDLGEDCALFQEIENYKRSQEEGETQYKCACGELLTMKYRHASADRTQAQNDEASAYALSRS